MHRLAWCSDIHLNHLGGTKGVARFIEKVIWAKPDALAITGDIAEGDDVDRYLDLLRQTLTVPIYFCAGNHDYYRSSIKVVREKLTKLAAESAGRLTYLTACTDPVRLTDTACIVGHDGWGDGRVGKTRDSIVELADWEYIHEFKAVQALYRIDARLKLVRQLGDEAAAHFRMILPKACSNYQNVVVLIHPPPFPEATWHDHAMSDPDWIPWFCCVAAGEAIREVAEAYPQTKITVLTGHTHGEGYFQARENLVVKTSGTDYGRARVEDVLEL
jgi:3',5'-cyclic-AMP phosphodiesterase